MYLIQVILNDRTTLVFRVIEYELREGRIIFTDALTGKPKDFPSSMVIIDKIQGDETR